MQYFSGKGTLLILRIRQGVGVGEETIQMSTVLVSHHYHQR